MNDLTKIPFGLRESDHQFVDVAEVPNGKQCCCVCPSCGTPLEARQGEINVWHFAHAGRKVYGKTRKECEFSFYVSIRMMAKQLLGKQLTLGLPSCRGRACYNDPALGYRNYKDFQVSQEREITLENLAVESQFSGTVVDVLGTINGYSFVVYFTHPGRNVPENLHAPENDKCGVVAVALDMLPMRFKSAKAEGKGYRAILTDFLTNDRTAKTWVYHPNYKACEAGALAEMTAAAQEQSCLLYTTKLSNRTMRPNLEIEKAVLPTIPVASATTEQVYRRQIGFECVICEERWTGYEAGGNICPKCGSHLYSRQIDPLNN